MNTLVRCLTIRSVLFGAFAYLYTVSPAYGQGASSINLSGQYGPVVHLSSGSNSGGGGGLSASIVNATTGGTTSGSPVDVETFAFNVDFGDLARGDGNPVVGAIGLRIRSNTRFKLMASVLSFNATPLIYEGKELGAGDKGSFVRFWLGPINSTGAGASTAAISVNGAVASGMQMSELAHGPVNANSTLICTGNAASQTGSIQSQNNGIDIPIYVSVPTGYELGPAPGQGRGSFSFSLQFGVYSQ